MAENLRLHAAQGSQLAFMSCLVCARNISLIFNRSPPTSYNTYQRRRKKTTQTHKTRSVFMETHNDTDMHQTYASAYTNNIMNHLRRYIYCFCWVPKLLNMKNNHILFSILLHWFAARNYYQQQVLCGVQLMLVSWPTILPWQTNRNNCYQSWKLFSFVVVVAVGFILRFSWIHWDVVSKVYYLPINAARGKWKSMAIRWETKKTADDCRLRVINSLLVFGGSC